MNKCSTCAIFVEKYGPKLEEQDLLRDRCKQLYKFVEWVLNSKHSKKARRLGLKLLELPPKDEPADNANLEAVYRGDYGQILADKIDALRDIELAYFDMLELWLTPRRWAWIRKDAPKSIVRFIDKYWWLSEGGNEP